MYAYNNNQKTFQIWRKIDRKINLRGKSTKLNRNREIQFEVQIFIYFILFHNHYQTSNFLFSYKSKVFI